MTSERPGLWRFSFLRRKEGNVEVRKEVPSGLSVIRC